MLLSQVTLTPTQSESLVRLIKEFESLKERHAIVIGMNEECERIVWKYGDMINECDRLRESCEERVKEQVIRISELVEENEDLNGKLWRTRLIGAGASVASFIGGVILFLVI